jgi:hypothetical protein
MSTPKPKVCVIRATGPKTEATAYRRQFYIYVEWIRFGVTYKRQVYEPYFIDLSDALVDLLVNALEIPFGRS